MDRRRFDWADGRVTFVWPDHPLVLGGSAALASTVLALDADSPSDEIVAALVSEFGAPPEDARSYVEDVRDTIDSVQAAHVSNGDQSHVAADGQSLAMATLNLTRACNLKCAHCYAEADSKSPAEEMAVDDVVRTVGMLGKLITREPRLLVISGGEPTLQPEKLMAAVTTARKGGLTPRLNTNGILITETLARFLSDQDVLVQVSIDGADAKTHALLRGSEASFDAALRGVALLVNSGCRVRISCTTHSENFAQVPRMIQLAEELGAEQLVTSGLVAVGRAHGSALRPVEFAEEFRVLYDAVKGDIERQEMTRSTLLAETITSIREGIRFTYCGTGSCTCCVDADGTLYPCINMMRRDYRVGNLLASECGEASELWESSPVLGELRNLNVDTMNAACRKCTFRYFCGAYCRGETIEAGKSIDAPYARCAAWKRGLTTVLDILSESPELYQLTEEAPQGVLHRE